MGTDSRSVRILTACHYALSLIAFQCCSLDYCDLQVLFVLLLLVYLNLIRLLDCDDAGHDSGHGSHHHHHHHHHRYSCRFLMLSLLFKISGCIKVLVA